MLSILNSPIATGQLVGINMDDHTYVSTSFPYENDLSEEFQTEALKNVRDTNGLTSIVGWYTVTNLSSNFWFSPTIETMFSFQSAIPEAICIIHDPLLKNRASLPFFALRLSDKFMDFYKNKKFTMEAMCSNQMSPETVFDVVPIQFENTRLIEAVFYALEDTDRSKMQKKLSEPNFSLKPTSLDGPLLSPNCHALNVPIGDSSYSVNLLDALLEKQEEYMSDQHRWQGWLRVLIKEQTKLNSMAANKKTPTDGAAVQPTEEELQQATQNVSRLQSSELSRLDSLLCMNQIYAYGQKAKEFSETTSFKIDLLGKLN